MAGFFAMAFSCQTQLQLRLSCEINLSPYQVRSQDFSQKCVESGIGANTKAQRNLSLLLSIEPSQKVVVLVGGEGWWLKQNTKG